MSSASAIFDAHGRVERVRSEDLETLVRLGTRAVVAAAHDAHRGTRAEDLRGHLDELVGEVPDRLRQVGLTPYVCVGIHPARIPWLGVDALLGDLPDYLDRPEVVGLGEIGLHEGTEREEEVFRRQVELGRALRVPLVVYLPEFQQEKTARRTLALLSAWEVPPETVLVVRADAAAAALAREMGCRVALGRIDAGTAARWVARQGPDGLLLSGELGDGLSDPARAARTLSALEEAGLSAAVRRRVAWENAAAFFGVAPRGD